MESNPSLCLYNLGLLGYWHPNFNWQHRPIVCGLLGTRTAVLSSANRIPGFVDPCMVKLPLRGESPYVLAPAVYLPRQNWPFGFALTFPDSWPPR